ncbi:unnamed protein product, partial [Rotaria socialis]
MLIINSRTLSKSKKFQAEKCRSGKNYFLFILF